MAIMKKLHEEVLQRIQLIREFNEEHPNAVDTEMINTYINKYTNAYSAYTQYRTMIKKFFDASKQTRLKIDALNAMLELHKQLDNYGFSIMQYYSKLESLYPADDVENRIKEYIVLSEKMAMISEKFLRKDTINNVRTILFPKASTIPINTDIMCVYKVQWHEPQEAVQQFNNNNGAN